MLIYESTGLFPCSVIIWKRESFVKRLEACGHACYNVPEEKLNGCIEKQARGVGTTGPTIASFAVVREYRFLARLVGSARVVFAAGLWRKARRLGKHCLSRVLFCRQRG